ncbi:MAG: GNAT family N-acetyltransferase [Vampirovibrionales bacterium]|nr:GNAT family N-acetyltransferase [Vampirovibrionales bacterium]
MAAVNPRGGIVYEESRDKDGYNGILLLDSYETKFPQSTHLDALKQVAMMHQIQVRPDARGFGTGTRLVQKALTEARQNGFKYALMASDSRDPGLNRFVEKQGFQKADANLPAPVQRVLDEMRVLENPDSLAAALKNPHEIYYWRRV